MEQMIIQITSGRGPAACCRVVAKVQEKIIMSGMPGSKVSGDISRTAGKATAGGVTGTLCAGKRTGRKVDQGAVVKQLPFFIPFKF